MYDKAVDSYLPALKFVPDWFVPSKIIEKLDHSVFSNDDIVFGDIDSDIVTFFSNDIGLNSISLVILILLRNNLTMVILKLSIILDLWLGIINISNTKHVKKDR